MGPRQRDLSDLSPDRFANGDSTNDPVDSEPWGSPPTARGFQGGDLNGIVDRLDYLERLGVDVIYLNPVFLSPSTHRYDTVDYHQVDPHLGGGEALRELVEASHRRGMKVILDASFNHCHPRFFAFEDLLEKGQQSDYRNWFKINEWPIRIKVRSPLHAWQREWLPIWAGQARLELDYVDDEGPAVEPTYDTWYGVATMPSVDLANPEARAYMLEVAEKWLLDPGIDGWRMDMALRSTTTFRPEFRQVARKARSDAYLIGEFLGDASIWLQGDQFDATMNYSFHDLAWPPGHRTDRWNGGECRASPGFGRSIPGPCPWPIRISSAATTRPDPHGRRGPGMATSARGPPAAHISRRAWPLLRRRNRNERGHRSGFTPEHSTGTWTQSSIRPSSS